MHTSVLACLLSAFLFAVGHSPAPRFADYSVSEPFSSVVAPLQTPPGSLGRLYRTLFATEMKLGPNFAGHYRVVTWGEGTGLSGLAFIDLATGEAFQDPVVSVVLFPHLPGEAHMERYGISHRRDSTLLVVRGVPGEYTSLGTYFFRLEALRLVRIRHFVWSSNYNRGAR